jgi:hypothetical protein
VVDAPKGVVGRVDEVEKAGDTRLSLPSYIDKGRAAQYVHAQAKSQKSKAVSQSPQAMSQRTKGSAAMRQHDKPQVTLGYEKRKVATLMMSHE